MRYQVISRDYNGTTTILATESELTLAIDRIRSEVTDLNFNNALTTDNKFRSIEAYFPEFIDSAGDIQSNTVYAGSTPTGNHLVLTGDGVQNLDGDLDTRFYIGKNEGEEFFLADHRDNQISDWDNELLNGKTYFFVKAIT